MSGLEKVELPTNILPQFLSKIWPLTLLGIQPMPRGSNFSQRVLACALTNTLQKRSNAAMAAMNFGDAFDTLANDELWIDVVMIFVGFFGSSLLASAFESFGPDLPNELYGIGVAAGNEMFTDYRMITAGAGLYSVDVLAERVGVKGEISNLAGGS